ncbi:MAG: 4Fe-4S dicluster domain-containing protein [Lachnospiraceae bacterium]|nr:4Fe-4S dicluster domain-containing protein [Lachnospiraceae bacterium]
MGKVFLTGHTGSVNKGCEAIVRSTVKILKQNQVEDITLFTNNMMDDYAVGINTICKIMPTSNYGKFRMRKIIAKLFLKIFGSYYLDELNQQKKCFELVNKGDVVFVIGGDTYCYGRPVGNYAANRFAHKRGAKTILWGCSIENELITNEMIKDLKSYDLICPREALTVENLIKIGVSPEKIVKIADPAFNLDMKKSVVNLDDSESIVGLNVSPIVKRNPKAYNAVIKFVAFILEKTNYKILLVPHVYKEGTLDAFELNDIKNSFKEYEQRFIEIKQELSCEMIKYCISKCKFFIGARTHSTIAAYSNNIPTIVIGYSIKSKGIAKDLFETTDKYVLNVEKMENDELINSFLFVEKNYDKIKRQLEKKNETYKKTTVDAIKKITEGFEIDRNKKIYWNDDSCSGCGACAEVCPQKCIEMKADKFGFLYPVVDNHNCINCGKCRSVCHYQNRGETKLPDKVMLAINRDSEIRNISSSGGVFWSLGNAIIKSGGIVFGCILDSNINVVHSSASTLVELEKMLGSKYVQSVMGNTFEQVERQLINGRKVLFSGTPCQINSLYSYLRKEYCNLYTVDFICHGVPSPLVWENYKAELEKKYYGKIVEGYFRDKTEGWKLFSMKLVFENGKIYRKNVKEDPFLRSFISDICLRKSCNNCAAKGIERCADFTLADLWGVKKIKPIFSDDRGVSALIIRGDKALELFCEIKNEFEIDDLEIEVLIKMNPSIVKSVNENKMRDSFINLVATKSFKYAYTKYVSNSLWAKIHRKLGF